MKEVNKQGLCGAKDWRLPSYKNLVGLVFCSTGKYNYLANVNFLETYGYGSGNNGWVCGSDMFSFSTVPTINTDYFADTTEPYGVMFWSVASFADDITRAVGIDLYGLSVIGGKNDGGHVRLVRG